MSLFKKRLLKFSSDQMVRLGNKLVHVGRFTYGVKHIQVETWGESETLSIGRYCSIAGKIRIYTGGSHRVDWLSTYPFGHIHPNIFGKDLGKGHPKSNGDVIIGNDVWIADGVTIMSGVTVGDGAVLAANSHVIKDVPPYTMVGGNPAKVIRARFPEEVIETLLKFRWWEFSREHVSLIADRLCSEPTIELLDSLIKDSQDWPRD